MNDRAPMAVVDISRQRLDGSPVGKRTGAYARAWTAAGEAAFIAALLANGIGVWVGRGDQLKCQFAGAGTVFAGARFRAWWFDGQAWYCMPALDFVLPNDTLANATVAFGAPAPLSGQYLWTLDDAAGGTCTAARFVHDVEKS